MSEGKHRQEAEREILRVVRVVIVSLSINDAFTRFWGMCDEEQEVIASKTEAWRPRA